MSNKLQKIKIGIMGCAKIAKRSTLPALQELDNLFEIVAISSRDYSKAKFLANEFNCIAVHGYDALLSMKDLDAVYIPLPTGLHEEWINKALDADLHVYSEKSIAMCQLEAKAMVSKASTKSLALMEGYMFQYHSQYNIIKNLINKGEIGEVRSFHGSFCFPALSKSDFRYNMNIGGGVVMDAAGYPLRAAHHLFGHDLKVKASSLHFDSQLQSVIWGSAFLANNTGFGGSINFGFDNYYQCRFEICGSKGKIVAERAFTPSKDMNPSIYLEKNGKIGSVITKPDNHFIKAFREFYFIINETSKRQQHYDDIILQSQSLDLINKLAK